MISGFEWDESKNAENLRKHGVSFEEAVEVFNGPHLSREEDRFDYGEVREISIGMIGSVTVLVVVHTDRDGNVRIISARKATKPERRLFNDYLEKAFGRD